MLLVGIRSATDMALYPAANVGGVFRVPGSVRVVSALYSYYCDADKENAHISTTVRSGSLPTHFNYTIQDVASTFKKFLSTMPGGILGSLKVFDIFVAIHTQVRSDPKHGHATRARLIALAVGTVQSHLRRELICAVFGLLSFLGSAAENVTKTDEDGKSTVPFNLMNYEALGIVFGPLLVGDLLSSQTAKLEDPSQGVVLFPVTPPMSKSEKQRKLVEDQLKAQALAVDKIWVANQVAIMILRHWKDAVEYMRGYGALIPNRKAFSSRNSSRRDIFRPSVSDPALALDQEDTHLSDVNQTPSGSTFLSVLFGNKSLTYMQSRHFCGAICHGDAAEGVPARRRRETKVQNGVT